MKIFAKRSISYILVLTLVFVFFNMVTVQAEETEYTTNGYRYTIDANGAATITRYTKYDTAELLIPNTLDGHKVVGIGDWALDEHEELTSVVVPTGITSIGRGVFSMDINLTSVKLPEGLVSIGKYAFNACGALKSIELPDSVTSMGELVFCQCKSLTSVKLPAGITRIESGTFSECYSLTTFTIPSTVTSIGISAFLECKSLKEVYIPPTVTSIENYAFALCPVLKEIVIPDSVTTVGKELFDGNYDAVVYYPKGLLDNDTTIETGVSYVINSDGTASVTVEKVPEGTTKVSIPGTIMGKAVTDVKTSGSVDISKVEIELQVPFTITRQPADVSFPYGKADNVTMTAGVTVTPGITEPVTYQWYENNTEIRGATAASYAIPANKKAGSYIYCCEISCGDYHLKTAKATATIVKKKVTVQTDSVTRVKGKANPVFTYTVPSGALVIGDTTDNWVVNLTTSATKNSPAGTYQITGTIIAENYDVKVKPGVLTVVKTSPKKGASIQDSKNKAVYKVTKAGTTGGTTGTVTYMKPVKSSVKTVSIPTTITADGIKYKVTGIAKNAFKNNKKITKVTVGKYVKTIGSSAFYNCTELKTVTLGAAVTTLGDKAFYKCTALKSITLPSKVSKIGKKTFYGCKNLKNITVKTKNLTTKKIGSDAFKGIYSKAKIKVPKSKYKTYKSLFKKRGAGKKVQYKKG